MQPGEVGAAISIAGDNLPVENGRLGRQLVQQLRNGRKAFGEIMPIAAVDEHARAYLVDLDAIVVEFHLVQPGVAGRYALGRHGVAGLDEAERGHSSGCSETAAARQLGLASCFSAGATCGILF